MKHSNGSKAIKRFDSHLKYLGRVTDLALGRSYRRSKPMAFVGKARAYEKFADLEGHCSSCDSNSNWLQDRCRKNRLQICGAVLKLFQNIFNGARYLTLHVI